MFSPGTGTENFAGHDSFMSLSPGSPAPTHTMPQTHSSPFLPGYLLGDHHSHHHAVSSPRLWSSGGSHSPASKSGGLPGQAAMPSAGSGLIRQESLRTKVGGPPVKSLYSSPTAPDTSLLGGTPSHNRTHSSPALRQMSVSTPAPPTTGLFHTQSRGDTSFQAMNQSQTLPVSPAQADPFYTQGDLKSDDVLDETWVTVFGFPPGATSFILQQFSQYGTILKHVVASECNWMHIHYMSKIQAKKALSKDGKIYGGCMKIGVTPCIDKNIMEEKENQSMYSSPANDDPNRSTLGLNASTLTPIRPLTAAYVASRGEYEVLRDKPTPKRDSGLVSKLKEYMFGY